MNILFLLGTYPNYGGVETVTTFLANEFIKKGIKVSIISFRNDVPDLINQLDDKIKLYQFPSRKVLDKSNIKYLKELIKDNNIDFILNQWCLPFYVTLLCKKAIVNTNCKLFAIHHNAPNQNSMLQNIEIELNKNISFIKSKILRLKRILVTFITQKSMKYVYNNSDAYILLSDSFIKIFVDFVGIKEQSKLKVITNPLTIETNLDLDIYNNKENEIIYVGRVDYNQKRVSRIIEVWSLLEHKFPDWKLKIVGDGPELNSLKELAQHKDLKQVYFEGFQNPVEYYKSAKVLVLMSEYEGFPLVLIEGSNYGSIPVVYGSYDAVYDMIEHNINGIIIDKKNNFPVELTANKIESLIRNEEELKKISKEAIKKSKSFEKDAIINLWIKLFNE
ncbi:glycosyltransferase [Empedobacter sp.]|uniref:glycosyltransferase n=1 Tax=Empedobacter sp. TaxID=1927715 RepID=UPI00289BBCE5|nr:glycosyltransferase [Empedobacter sp.]